MCRLALTLALVLLLVPTAFGGTQEITELLQKSSDHYSNNENREAFENMDEALEIIWQEAEMWIDEAVLVAEPGEGYGVYTPRTDNVFKQGEPILLYVAPMGYRHNLRDDGKFEFGVVADFYLKLPDGEVLGGQRDFQRMTMVSRYPNREMFLSLTYNISGAPPGEYILETVLHDIVSGSSATIETPFIIE